MPSGPATTSWGSGGPGAGPCTITKATGAVRHSILVACWPILTKQVPYVELGGDYFDRRRDPDRETRALVRKLERLGHRVILAKADAARPQAPSARRGHFHPGEAGHRRSVSPVGRCSPRSVVPSDAASRKSVHPPMAGSLVGTDGWQRLGRSGEKWPRQGSAVNASTASSKSDLMVCHPA